MPVKNLEILINDIELQLDYNNESYNNKFFYELYKDNKYINIPNIEYYNEDMIIMETIETKTNEDMSDLCKYKCLLLLIVFINYNCLNNLSHGDMHYGNWSIQQDTYSYINIFDFGFCFSINNKDHFMIDKYVGEPTNN